MGTRLRNLRASLSTVADLLRGIWRGPHWWLAPLVMVLLPTALVLIFMQAYPVLAPFVYSLF